MPAARVRLDAVVREGQGRAEHWNLLGVAHAQLEEWPAAIRAFSHAVQLAPENDYYQQNLQRAREEGGR